jgi:hypothetical protein
VFGRAGFVVRQARNGTDSWHSRTFLQLDCIAAQFLNLGGRKTRILAAVKREDLSIVAMLTS